MDVDAVDQVDSGAAEFIYDEADQHHHQKQVCLSWLLLLELPLDDWKGLLVLSRRFWSVDSRRLTMRTGRSQM